MNLDVCKACKHCEVSPRPGAPLSDTKRQHYHCLLAMPTQTPHGAAFTQENPTNFIAEEFEDRRVVNGKLEIVPVTKLKEMFKVPPQCPRKNEH